MCHLKKSQQMNSHAAARKKTKLNKQVACPRTPVRLTIFQTNSSMSPEPYKAPRAWSLFLCRT